MPLLLTRQVDTTTWLGIWQLQEPVHDLLSMLPPHADTSEMRGKAHPRRQQEWLASRVLVYQLLQHLTEEPLVLARNEDGKPYFPNQPLHVSITHSLHLAAVILSGQHQVGIDIELLSPKALRVENKFLTETEKRCTASDETATCLYWSAKETLYKLYSRKKLVLKENLLVSPGDEPNVLLGRVQTENFSKLYRIHHDIVQEHVLTYCIDSKK